MTERKFGSIPTELISIAGILAATAAIAYGAKAFGCSVWAICIAWLVGACIGTIFGLRRGQVLVFALSGGLIGVFCAAGFWMTAFARFFGP